MKNEKLNDVIQGIVILVFGILIAVCGIDATVNIYFGILFTVIGAVALAVIATLLIKKSPILPAIFFLAGVSLTVGICLFTNWVSFAALIPLIVAVVLGLGCGLLIHGLYVAVKSVLFYGIGEMVVGATVIALSIVYIFVPNFQHYFWYIAGILIAVYGAFAIIYAIVRKR